MLTKKQKAELAAMGHNVNDVVSSIPGMKMQSGGSTQNLYKDKYGNNSILEGDEHVKLPNGQSFEVTGDKHSDPSGGEKMNLPGGSKVYSEKEKASKELASMILGKVINKKLSFADLADKYSTDKDVKNMNSNDIYDKNTAQHNLVRKNQKLDDIFLAQELTKQVKGMDNDLEGLLSTQQPDNNQQSFGPGGLTDSNPGGSNPMSYNGFQDYYDQTLKQQFHAPKDLNREDFYANPRVREYLRNHEFDKGIDGDIQLGTDGVWGYRHQYAYDNYYKNSTLDPIAPQNYRSQAPVMQGQTIPLSQFRDMALPNSPEVSSDSVGTSSTVNNNNGGIPGFLYDPRPAYRANNFGLAASLFSNLGRVDRPVLNPGMPNMVLPKPIDLAQMQNIQVNNQVGALASQLNNSNVPESVKQALISSQVGKAYENIKPESVTDYTNTFNNTIIGMQNDFNKKSYSQNLLNMDNYNRSNSAINAGLDQTRSANIGNVTKYIQNNANLEMTTPLMLEQTGMIPKQNRDGTWTLTYDNTNNLIYDAQLRANGLNPINIQDNKDEKLAQLKYQVFVMEQERKQNKNQH